MPPSPLVSVLMPVHNGERFLREAIESILGQTFSDFEFIVIDDGSTDSTPDIIAKYAELDSRLIFVRREMKGLTKSLNEGLKLARGPFIARHDADDIALPHRLSTMVDFLEANPSLAAAGSWCETMDDDGRSTGKITDPADHDHIAWAMAGYNAIIHPSAVIRRQSIAKYGAYDEEYSYAQDYELWTRWIRLGAKLANVPEILVKYRRGNSDQISHKFAGQQLANAERVSTAHLNFLLSDTLPPRQVRGVRQLIGFSAIDSDAIRAVPVLVRLLRLPRFRRSIGSSSMRLRPARRSVSAIRKFGAADRKAGVAGLMIAARIWTRLLLERGWWTCLLRQVWFSRPQMPPYGHQ